MQSRGNQEAIKRHEPAIESQPEAIKRPSRGHQEAIERPSGSTYDSIEPAATTAWWLVDDMDQRAPAARALLESSLPDEGGNQTSSEVIRGSAARHFT